MSKTLMVQGTTSDAGKSVMVAGLCRLLQRRGLSVAPFKPQNMALNSAVTADGGEIGRAQAVQARACGLPPHIDMNPVLLKPNSDTGAQVIIHGKALSNMEAQAYHDYKKVALEAVLTSHRRLGERYDWVIVEGAGSPAEINLRANDIANMGFAEAVDCPVILIADIDRGGVFAHLVGTLALLAESEQRRVCGFMINRFRGDIALLQSGLDWLEDHTGKPVLGVIPYLHDLHLEAEDAISTSQHQDQAQIRVVVPVLSRISNHTDFDVLRMHPQVDLKFIGKGQAIPPCELVILPGSKSVCRDLDFLRDNDWDEQLQRHLRYGGKVLGICGGFQMLGTAVHDPLGIEGPSGSRDGLKLLDMETILAEEKILRQVQGRCITPLQPGQPGDAPMPDNEIAGQEIVGYEIHAGRSSGAALSRPFAALKPQGGDQQHFDGAVSADGQVAGTYVHGVFDQEAARNAILQWAGVREVRSLDYEALIEANLDRLADAIEQAVDIDALLASV